MKIANIVTNVVLGAAVVVLFVLHFSGNEKTDSSSPAAAERVSGDLSDIRIAHFNMDSVMAGWDLYFEYQQELNQKQTELETDFAGRTERFYQSVQDAQYKIQKGLVTRSEAQELQQNLASEEQNLMGLQNQYSMELQEEGLVKQRKLLDMIERYVAELSESTGYEYVYSYSFGGNLVYGAPSNDITPEVIDGLNAKFSSETSLD